MTTEPLYNALECDMSKVYGLEFKGGTLDQLFDRHARTWEHLENGDILIRNKDNAREFSFMHRENKYKVHIYSTESISSGNEGVHIRDTGTRIGEISKSHYAWFTSNYGYTNCCNSP